MVDGHEMVTQYGIRLADGTVAEYYLPRPDAVLDDGEEWVSRTVTYSPWSPSPCPRCGRPMHPIDVGDGSTVMGHDCTP